MAKAEDFISSCPYCCQPITASDARQRFCPNCGKFLLCAHCRRPVTKADKELGKCPHCGAMLITPAREAELAELNKLDMVQREKSRERTQESLSALFSKLSKERFERLLAISDEEWEAATEDKSTQDEHMAPPTSRQKKTRESRKPEEIEMICPLCGHAKVTRYPYRCDGWQYVCQGCKCSFDPELER
jgi:predicted RNA-binding Zn-ribbon protein involved in translation (DUF1610 family)